MIIKTVKRIELIVPIVVMMLLTGCATKSNRIVPVGLEAVIDSEEMVWLGNNLDEKEWGYLSYWLKNKLTPYVVRLEVRQ